MFRPEDLRRVVEKAGLSKGEIAALYGITRTTLYDWLGDAPPRVGGPLERLADSITQALLVSIAKKILPMPAVDRAVRRRRIESMRKTLQNLKPRAVE